MHSIGEINIGVPSVAEHDLIAGRHPPERVRGRVGAPHIGLDLNQLGRYQAARRRMHEHAAK
jgi:hypothetical protein